LPDERDAFEGVRARRVRFSGEVFLRQLGDEAVLLKLTDESAFSLNATSARIAALILEGRPVADIVDRLAEEYDLPAATLLPQVGEFVDTLLMMGLVELVDGAKE
jgi:hypothetical protein